MKKSNFFLLILFLCLAHLAFSQTEKGSWLAGGSGYLQGSRGGDSYVATNLRPQVGYFIAKNLAFGVSLPLSFSGSWAADSFRDYYTYSLSVGTGLFGRYYFLRNKTKLFVHGALEFAHIRNRNEIYVGGSPPTPSSNIRSRSVLNHRFGIGLVHFITPSVGLELVADYRNQRIDFMGNAQFSYHLEVGLFAYLNKNKGAEGSFLPNTNAKNLIVGGTTGLAFINTGFQNTRNFSFAPKVGMFIKDKWAVGASMPLTFATSEFNNTFSYNYRSNVTFLGFNAFTRYYFLPNKTKLFVLGEFGFSYAVYKDTYSGANIPTIIGSPERSKSKLVYALGGGIARFLSPSIAVEATLDYRSMPYFTDQRVLYGQVGVFAFLRKD